MPGCERCCHSQTLKPCSGTPGVKPIIPVPMRPRVQQYRIADEVTFGVELELCFPEGVSKTKVKKAVDRAAGHRRWKLVADSSIRCNLHCASMEVNTPVMQGEGGLQEVLRVCDAINELHPMVNTTTGLHVHVAYGRGMRWPLPHLKQLAYNWLAHEEGLDLLVPPERRASNNSYAQSLKFQDDDIGTHLLLCELAGVHGVQGLDLIASLAQPGTFHGEAAATARAALHAMSDADQMTDMLCPFGHHHKLNLHALTKHGTVEFRHPAGTWDGQEIAHYVLLYTWFVHNSLSGYVRDWTAEEEGDPLRFLANTMYWHDPQLQDWMFQRAAELRQPSSSATPSTQHGTAAATAGPTAAAAAAGGGAGSVHGSEQAGQGPAGPTLVLAAST